MNILCFTAGFAFATLLFWFMNVKEWHERKKLSNRIDDLHKHLACGAGFLGCKGGPKCTSDHK